MALVETAAIIGLFLFLTSARGPYPAAWLMWPIALLLLPTWVFTQLGSLRIDFRTAIAFVAVISLAFDGGRGRRARFVLTDAVVAMLLLSDIITMAVNTGVLPLTIPDLARVYLPYLLGRLYLRTTDDIPRAMGPICAVCLALLLLAIGEAVTRVNLLGVLTGRGSGADIRLGLKRAFVSAQHPIALGNIMVMMLPWTLVSARRARAGAGPAWWRIGPKLAPPALLSTISRGAILAGMGTFLIDMFFHRPRLRVPLLALAAAVGIATQNYQEDLIWALSEISGENATDQDEVQIIEIKGKEQVYTGTRHRLLLQEVYADGLARAGAFGFGNNWATTRDEESPDVFWSIDNHYLGLQIGKGYMGHGLFLLLVACSLVNLARVAFAADRPHSDLAGALFGAMLSIAVALNTVHLDPQLGAAYYFTAGLAASFRHLPTEDPEPGPDPAEDEDDPPSPVE